MPTCQVNNSPDQILHDNNYFKFIDPSIGQALRSTDGPGCDSEEPPGTGISMKRVGEGVELLEAFAGLEDPHQSGKVVYLLMEIMVVLSGCDDFVEIA